MANVRLYDTNQGVIATDERNKSLSKPGYELIFYNYLKGTINACRTGELIKPDNVVQEIPDGSRITWNLQEIVGTIPLVRRVTTITREEYDKTLFDYQNPGCSGKIWNVFRLGKKLDDRLRAHFK